MLVSGLPLRNERRHAGEVGTLSLDLLSVTQGFRIRHAPEKRLLLRIGVHSGKYV